MTQQRRRAHISPSRGRVAARRLRRARHDVVIRSAVPPDAGALHELSLPFVAGGALLPRPPSYFDANIGDFRVVEVDGRIAGCVGVHRYHDAVELYNVCVAGGHHGLGLGRLLVVDALAHAAADGYAEVFLLSAVAAGWFARFGFRAMAVADLPPGRARLMVPGRSSTPMRRRLRRGATHSAPAPAQRTAWAA
jgi:amino-acid N-acetyltransferase